MDGSSSGTKTPTSAKSPKAIAREKAEREAAAAAKTATKAKPTKPADDDPFAVAPQKKSKAIPLRRKPTAKTTYRVVCPMCDTNGFATPAVAGKEVKCPNPKCLMPIFTAPEIKKEAPPPPKKSLVTPLNLALFGILLVAIGGGLFYAFVLNEPEQPDGPDPLDPTFNPPIVEETTDDPAPESNDPPPPPKISIPELETNILNAGVEAARSRDDNRSKDLCRILTASAYAERDQLEQAFGQLQAFDNLNSGIDFMKIAPLCRIAWKHLDAGDRGAAEKIADQAVEFSQKLPRTGDDAVIQAVALGTLLVALDRFDDAKTLVDARESVQEFTQAVARISMVIQDDTFDLARSFRWLPQVDLASPLSFAISYGATVRGYGDQTAGWIRQLDSSERQSICLAGYAAALGMLPNSSADQITNKIDSFSDIPELDRQRAVGLLLQVVQLNSGGKSADVTALQQRLSTAVAEKTALPASELPDFRGIYEGKFRPAPAETKLRTQLHLLLAHSLAESGQSKEAWEQIQQALNETAAIAPAKQAVASVMTDIERGRDRIQSRLGREYEISRADLQRNAFNQYRKNAREIEQAASRRYEQEESILNLALSWGLVKPLYEQYQEMVGTDSDSNLVQIVEADIPANLIFALNEAGQSSEGQSLAGKWGIDVAKSSSLSSERQMKRLIESGRGLEAFQFYNSNRNTLERPLLFLQLSTLMAETADVPNVYDWIGVVPDPVEKELCYRLTAAQLTQRGLLRETWKASQNRNLSATDKCSLYLGLLEGLSTTNRYDPPAPTPASEEKSQAAAVTTAN